MKTHTVGDQSYFPNTSLVQVQRLMMCLCLKAHIDVDNVRLARLARSSNSEQDAKVFLIFLMLLVVLYFGFPGTI